MAQLASQPAQPSRALARTRGPAAAAGPGGAQARPTAKGGLPRRLHRREGRAILQNKPRERSFYVLDLPPTL